MKIKKPPGRPRAFDMDTALHQAMKTFWAKGYEATSLDDLQQAMGIARPSLYHAFGDKRSLFLRCLSYYADNVASQCVVMLHSEPEIHQAVRAFLRRSALNVGQDSLGCLVGCVASSVDDPEVREFMRVSSQGVQESVAEVLRQAVSSGQLPADFPVVERARRAFDMMIALGFRGRSGVGPDELKEDADRAAELILNNL